MGHHCETTVGARRNVVHGSRNIDLALDLQIALANDRHRADDRDRSSIAGLAGSMVGRVVLLGNTSRFDRRGARPPRPAAPGDEEAAVGGARQAVRGRNVIDAADHLVLGNINDHDGVAITERHEHALRSQGRSRCQACRKHHRCNLRPASHCLYLSMLMPVLTDLIPPPAVPGTAPSSTRTRERRAPSATARRRPSCRSADLHFY